MSETAKCCVCGAWVIVADGRGGDDYKQLCNDCLDKNRKKKGAR